MSPKNESRRNARELVAREAARIMLESGIDDHQLAKRKAAERLRINARQMLPGNDEIELALIEHQRLFRSASQPQRLQALRRGALAAMTFLARFEPRLVGPVLSGTADEHSEVCLHLFSDPNETVGIFLSDSSIPYDLGERRLRVTREQVWGFPSYRFLADDIPMELIVFDVNGQRASPLSPVDGRPMARADLATVRQLANDGTDVATRSLDSLR